MPIIFPRPPGREFRRCFPAWWRCGDARRMSSETQTHRESLLLSRKFRRIVVKIGSGVLADAEEGLRVPFIRALAAQVPEAWEERGTAFGVVTSGAIAAGRKKMGMGEKPRTVALKQAAAAVGQTSLMYAYERAFERRGGEGGGVGGGGLLILPPGGGGVFPRGPPRKKGAPLDAAVVPVERGTAADGRGT